jgi:hypothetical protein
MLSEEADWSSGADLGRMLALLDPKEGDRKLRLFAVACWRRAWGRLADPALQGLIDAAERYADRAAGYGELRAASQRAGAGSRPESPWNARWAAQAVAAVNAASTARPSRATPSPPASPPTPPPSPTTKSPPSAGCCTTSSATRSARRPPPPAG